MNLICSNNKLSGHITVPGSKSHTIRALILASLAQGKSIIRNPLASNDCISASNAVKQIGAKLTGIPDSEIWTVEADDAQRHIPQDIINVDNSGSTLYFFAPVCATFNGETKFTGDASIQKRPVGHLLDALVQLGSSCSGTETIDAKTGKPALVPPFTLSGPIHPGKVVTDGRLSQYISGLMMACSQIEGTTEITLTDPKEVPYLDMTKWWLSQVGVEVELASDYKHVKVTGPQKIQSFDKTIPSDWEGVAFPIIAALISKSKIYIDNVDTSGTQGDEKIVPILQSIGAKISYEKGSDGLNNMLFIDGEASVLSTKNLPNQELHVALADFPDAICALAVIACFTEGTTVLEDIEICRKKETDRINVMESELSKLGADAKDTGDTLLIHGVANGSNLHGGTVESYDDHRVAMSLSCLGLSLSDELIVRDAECCSVSFPGYVQKMNGIGANFTLSE